MDTTELKNRIVRAAVAWERAYHEKMPANTYRDLGAQESELAQAVLAYNYALLDTDSPEPKQ